MSHFLGGGFGGKAYVWPHTLLTALAARALNLAECASSLRARQMYSMVVATRRRAIQTIALGADKDGKLTGIRHESISATPVFDNYIEYAAIASTSTFVGRQRGNLDEPQSCPCEPQHADGNALSARGPRPFRARKCDG